MGDGTLKMGLVDVSDVEIKDEAHRYLKNYPIVWYVTGVATGNLTNTGVYCVFRNPYKVVDIYLAMAQILNSSNNIC